MKKYVNVSGALLRDDRNEDWKPLETRLLNPDAPSTQGLLAYRRIREVTGQEGDSNIKGGPITVPARVTVRPAQDAPAKPAEAPAPAPADDGGDTGPVAPAPVPDEDAAPTEAPAPAPAPAPTPTSRRKGEGSTK